MPRQYGISKPGMHNIRPVGQTWPTEGLNLARQAQNDVHSTYLFDRNTLSIEKDINFGPLIFVK